MFEKYVEFKSMAQSLKKSVRKHTTKSERDEIIERQYLTIFSYKKHNILLPFFFLVNILPIDPLSKFSCFPLSFCVSHVSHVSNEKKTK